MSTDERDSQLSAMFDGELPDSECELLARRLSRDPALQQQWSRYSLIGAVIRNEPLHARRAPGGRLAAGIAARLSSAIEAEAAAAQPDGGEVAAAPGLATGTSGAAGAIGASRWVRPAAGFAIAAGVAALSVFWLQGRAPQSTPAVAAAGAGAAGTEEIVAPAAAIRGPATEVVVASNVGATAAGGVAAAAGSGEPESYVVPLPTDRPGMAAPAQLANYVVAHSEYSTPLSRRSLLSALVAGDGVAVEPGAVPADVAAADAGLPAGTVAAEAPVVEAPGSEASK